MKFHLEGMGLVGSLMAWRLQQEGIPFTWHDTEETVTAWRACTGACYPAGKEDSLDRWCYNQWNEWYDEETLPANDILERCPYIVDTVNKTLPHGLVGRSAGFRTVGSLRLPELPSLHVNAQRLVLRVRETFAAERRAGPPGDAIVIVAHSFSHRLQRYLWGWTRLVTLTYDIDRFGERACFYLRKNRFQFAYCYPSPGTRWWYAGSSLVSQTRANSLEIGEKYLGWRNRFHELTGYEVKVEKEGPCMEGWRPARLGSLSALEGHAGHGRSDKWLLIKQSERRIYIPPMTSNGFRHFPELWRQIKKVIA